MVGIEPREAAHRARLLVRVLDLVRVPPTRKGTRRPAGASLHIKPNQILVTG